MKLTIIGGAGVRTPTIIEAIYKRQDRIGISELSLLDINDDRLSLIGSLTEELEKSGKLTFSISRTLDPSQALKDADFVITTFRVGNIESRVIDERIALQNGVLGQETTGAGGFSMALRSIPVLKQYVEKMKELCPDAWLLNFANPSGILTEFLLNHSDWPRSVGICDGPSSMRHYAAKLLKASYLDVFLDYFGLNHLGWIRKILYQGKDVLPIFLKEMDLASIGKELPFSDMLIQSLQMIPNEYNYYYYYSRKSVNLIQKSEMPRGEQLKLLNDDLFNDLARLQGNNEKLNARYQKYQLDRSQTYMMAETGGELGKIDGKGSQVNPGIDSEEGYAGVALDVIEGLIGREPKILILNVLNEGAIDGIEPDSVVEIPVYVGKNIIRPLNVGKIPPHCLGLMNQVKCYEKMTIDAAINDSYSKAVSSLTFHPLIADEVLARNILDQYVAKHGNYYPKLVHDR